MNTFLRLFLSYITEKTAAPEAAIQFFLDRYHDPKKVKAAEKAVADKRQKAMAFFKEVEVSIGEVKSYDVDRLRKRLLTHLETKRTEDLSRLNKATALLTKKLKEALRKIEDPKETDRLDKEFSTHYTTYIEKKAQIESNYLDGLSKAAAQLNSSLEQYRHLHMTVQDPMRLKRDEAFEYAINLILYESELLELIERKRIDYKREWGKLKEWIRQNQYRVAGPHPRSKYYDPVGQGSKNTPEYNRILATLTKIFQKNEREAAYKKARNYLKKKKQEWENRIRSRNESYLGF